MFPMPHPESTHPAHSLPIPPYGAVTPNAYMHPMELPPQSPHLPPPAMPVSNDALPPAHLPPHSQMTVPPAPLPSGVAMQQPVMSMPPRDPRANALPSSMTMMPPADVSFVNTLFQLQALYGVVQDPALQDKIKKLFESILEQEQWKITQHKTIAEESVAQARLSTQHLIHLCEDLTTLKQRQSEMHVSDMKLKELLIAQTEEAVKQAKVNTVHLDSTTLQMQRQATQQTERHELDVMLKKIAVNTEAARSTILQQQARDYESGLYRRMVEADIAYKYQHRADEDQMTDAQRTLLVLQAQEAKKHAAQMQRLDDHFEGRFDEESGSKKQPKEEQAADGEKVEHRTSQRPGSKHSMFS